jgi:hypothetical protein
MTTSNELMHAGSGTLDGVPERHRSPLMSAGWLLVAAEVYLLMAGELALQSESMLAPPLLLVAVWDHWLPLSTIVAIVCFGEFVWRRTSASRIVLALAVLVAVAGEIIEIPNDASAAKQPTAERLE